MGQINQSTPDFEAHKPSETLENSSNSSNVIVVPAPPTRSVVIDGKEYQIKVYLSHKDDEQILALKDDCSENDCRIVLARAIYDKLQCEENQRPSIPQIAIQSEPFRIFISCIVETHKAISPFYTQYYNVDNQCKSFILAYREYIAENMKKVLEHLSKISKSMQEYQQQLQKTAFAAITAVTNYTQELLRSFGQTLQPICDTLQTINSSLFQLTEEERNARKDAVCRWGAFGWTFPPWEALNYFDNPPDTLEAADKQMLPYGKTAAMETLWEETKKESKCKKGDYNSAIFLFREKQYKACALMLFSLIDSCLIRFQSGHEGEKAVGRKAIEYLHKKVRGNPCFETTLLTYFVLFNVYSCLNVMYKSYKKFEGTPQIINRNFVVHGMTSKTVRKRDCVKLFYLYFNLLLLV